MRQVTATSNQKLQRAVRCSCGSVLRYLCSAYQPRLNADTLSSSVASYDDGAITMLAALAHRQEDMEAMARLREGLGERDTLHLTVVRWKEGALRDGHTLQLRLSVSSTMLFVSPPKKPSRSGSRTSRSSAS